MTSSDISKVLLSRTHHAIDACSWRLIHHSFQVVDVYDDPRHRSTVSYVPFRETYSTVGPSAGVNVISSIIVLSVGVDRWKWCSGPALSTRWDRWRSKSAISSRRRGIGRGGLRRSYVVIKVEDVAWKLDLNYQMAP